MHHALKLDASRSGAMMHSQLHANSLFNGILTACVCDADKGAGDAKADGSCEPRQAGPAASCSASAQLQRALQEQQHMAARLQQDWQQHEAKLSTRYIAA